jgi:outer membrane biosynthesis protein TonB
MEFDSRGFICTLLFHTIVLIIFIFFGFRTPLPLPEEAGILVNFGDIETGMGMEEPRQNEQVNTKPAPANKPETIEESSKEEPVLTQESEDAPAVKPISKPKDTKSEKKKEPVIKTPDSQQKKEEPKNPVSKIEEEPKVDTRALYTGKKENTQNNNSQGNTPGTGNQGSPSGSPDATNYGPGGGSGNTPGFDLEGRNSVSLPVPTIDIPKEGKVVVQIKVDRQGNVVDAIPGVKGSTTLDNYLLSVAKKAALASKFDSNPKAPYYQTGTINYIFRLK